MIIGNDGCTPGTETILIRSYTLPDNKFTPLQIAYSKNLQWKNTIKPNGTPTMIKADHI